MSDDPRCDARRSTELADELFAAIIPIRKAVHRVVRQGFPHPPLPEAQANLLRVVAHRPGISVRQAAEALQLAGNTVSTLVAALTAEGLLERATCPNDRRSARLELTERAASRLAEFDAHRSAAMGRVLAGLSEPDRAAIAGALPVLRRVVEALDAIAPD